MFFFFFLGLLDFFIYAACYGWAFPGVDKLEHLIKMEYKDTKASYKCSKTEKNGKKVKKTPITS